MTDSVAAPPVPFFFHGEPVVAHNVLHRAVDEAVKKGEGALVQSTAELIGVDFREPHMVKAKDNHGAVLSVLANDHIVNFVLRRYQSFDHTRCLLTMAWRDGLFWVESITWMSGT